MNQNQLQNIEQLEDRLWEAADQLRANSKLTSSEYCMPLLGVIFLRHATNRYEDARRQIELERQTGKVRERPVLKADYIKRRALMLPEGARYDDLLKLPKGSNLGSAIVDAMNAIERDFEPLKGQLPKEYDKFGNDLLESLLRFPEKEQMELLRFLLRTVPVSGADLPEPREFSPAEIEGWLAEDVASRPVRRNI